MYHFLFAKEIVAFFILTSMIMVAIFLINSLINRILNYFENYHGRIKKCESSILELTNKQENLYNVSLTQNHINESVFSALNTLNTNHKEFHTILNQMNLSLNRMNSTLEKMEPIQRFYPIKTIDKKNKNLNM